MITECRVAEYDEAEIPVAYSEDGNNITKTMEGEVEQLSYTCPSNMGPLQILRNMQNAFRAAGYQHVYTGKYSSTRHFHTVRNGPQWISIATDLNGDPSYNFTAVRVKEVEQQLEATAEAWTSTLEKSGRISVYGINFDTGKATLKPESEAVLAKLQEVLQNNPEWHVLVEGHTDNVGTSAANLALSKQRAEAVVAWLVAKGIEKPRLSAAGYGDKRPAADNNTDEGRAKNRRVDIVKQ
ncbi:MAG TPA: OmpA family protein [Bryobacteraceae bacterium]|nr:OmpA family protein [Bryobacteraceae bacterium]